MSKSKKAAPTPTAKSPLNRLALGGKPIIERSPGSTNMMRVRKDSLALPKKLLRDSQGGGAVISPKTMIGVTPAREGSERNKLAAKTDVDSYTRVRKGKVERVPAHQRDAQDRKDERPVYRASAASKQRALSDLEAWKKWKELPPGPERKAAMGALLGRFQGLIQKQLQKYGRLMDKVAIDPAALELEFVKHFVTACEKFDPSKGAQFTTWVMVNFEAARRMVATYQNTARIPEPLISHIGKMQRAQEHLIDVLGRDPTDTEVADYARIPLTAVKRLAREMRQGLVRSEFERDPSAERTTEESEILAFLRPELSDKEKVYYDYLQDAQKRGDEDALKPRVVAERLGLPPSEVSRVKRSIAERVMKHLGRS